nr:uroporphyrinogen-III C-methyltransferase [Deinococcus reticulitermitis]
MPGTESARAFVSLVGAGPGDPALLTLRARERLRQADVVLHDALTHPALLEHCPQAECLDVGKRGFRSSATQEDINALIVEKALEGGGRRVVRLKGGDPFVFGRGGEEALACVAAGIPFEIVPGVSSALAAPAYAGIPLTHRGRARSFAVLTGHDRHGAAAYGELAGVDTLAFLMAVRELPRITRDLIAAGRDPQTPAATVQSGSLPGQRVVRGSLATIAAQAEAAGIASPAVTVVGEVAALHDTLSWFVPAPISQPASPPLAGLRVAVTRTRPAPSTFAATLRAGGAEVTELPLLRFVPTGERRTVVGALRDFAGWVLLSSEQAVHGLFEVLEAEGLDARFLARARLAALGTGTARALQARGLRADYVPPTSGAAHLGAGLPAAAGDLALCLGDQEPDETLRSALAARGIETLHLAVFRSEQAELSENTLAALQDADLVTLASAAGARAFARRFGDAHTVAVIGPQTERAARAAGLTRIVRASAPTLDGLAEVVAALRAGPAVACASD